MTRQFRIHGDEYFETGRERLWQHLTQPAFLCDCFPGVDEILHIDERSAAIRVRPGFSFLRGVLDVEFQFLESESPSRALASTQMLAIGSSAELEVVFHIM